MPTLEPFNVIYQTAEDGLGDTVKPRLLEAEADLEKVLVIDDRDAPLTLTDERLARAIRENSARLVIIDPVQAFLGADVDMNRANEVRPILRSLGDVAQATGCAIGCMGGATVIFAPLGNFFIENFGVSTSFKLVGGILAVCYLIFAWFIKAPETDWKPEGWTPSAVGSNVSGKDVKTLAMLKHPMFWLMWVLFALAAASGMMMTGHASGIGQQLANLTAAQASLQVSILAAANFFGRLGFGSLSDKLGRYKTLYIVLVVTALDMLFGFKMVHGFVGFMIAICIIGACYGGVMTIMPTLCGDNFGSKNFGLNYACLYSGYTLASFVGPMLASNVLQKTGNYNQAFIIAGLMTLAGVVLVYAMSKYSKKQELNNKSE